jgi:hypothetical protein
LTTVSHFAVWFAFKAGHADTYGMSKEQGIKPVIERLDFNWVNK